jgi:hypothetical protein
VWKQFVDKPFWIVLVGLLAMFVFSIPAYQSTFAPLLLGLVGAAIWMLTWYRLEWGLAAAFAELFGNSHGHLVFTEVFGFTLSLRMVVFLAVMLGWVFLFVRGKVSVDVRDPRWICFLPLLVAVILGLVVGFSQNEIGKVFADGNAYFYLGYLLPILSVSWTLERRRLLLQTLCASAVWVTLLSLGLLYFFTHYPEWMLEVVYAFIRDTRTAELTKMVGSLFRVFLQAQISVMFMLFLFVPLLWVPRATVRNGWNLFFACSAGMSVVIIGLSRSFWLGIIVGVCVSVILSVHFFSTRCSSIARGAGILLLSGVVGVLLLVCMVLFPLPYRVTSTGDLSQLLSSRTTDASDVAVSSRWKLLPAIWDEIVDSPVVGKGFGEEVAFQTDDPRVRAFSPDGIWSTYALEWGWLELWLKMGILGPVSFLVLVSILARGLLPTKEDPQAWLSIGLLSMLCALYVTHVFSPYLNHPLGLGILLFTLPFFNRNIRVVETRTVVEAPRLTPSAVQASSAPITSE